VASVLLRQGATWYTQSEGGGGGGADTLITAMTVTETSGGNKTDELISLGFGIADGVVGSGQYLKVTDANDNEIPFQYENKRTIGGYLRRGRVSFIASPTANQTIKPKLWVTSDAPAAGTAITAADVLATSFDLEVDIDIDGTVYTFSALDALGTTPGTFSKTGYSHFVASSGPICTEFVLRGPPKNAGTGHASGDGLWVRVWLRAYKASSAAVSGGNPIKTVWWPRIEIRNEDAERASPAHYYYNVTVKRATSLSDGTLISTDSTDADGNVLRYAFADATPAVNLTLSSASTGERTVTRASGTWPTNIKGAHIKDANGAAIVISRDSATQVTAYVYDAFGGTTLSSGAWSLYGIGHHYNVPVWLPPGWVGQKLTTVACMGDAASALTADDNETLLYWADTGLILDYNLAFASATDATTAIDTLQSSDGSRRPCTILGGEGTDLGEIETRLQNAGAGGYVGPIPTWCVEGLAKWNAANRRRIFENAEHWVTNHWNYPERLSGSPSAGELGTISRSDGGSDYNWRQDGAYGPAMVQPGTLWWPYDGDAGHQPNAIYLAGLLTGDLCWSIAQQGTAEYARRRWNPSYDGAAMNRTSWGDLAGSSAHMGNSDKEGRAKAWASHAAIYANLLCADDVSAKILLPSTYFDTVTENMQSAAYRYGPNDVMSLHPGTRNQPAWIQGEGSESEHFSMQTFGMALLVFGLLHRSGLMTANGAAVAKWLLKGAHDAHANDNSIVRAIVSKLYWHRTSDATYFPGRPADWEAIHRRTCCLSPAGLVGNGTGAHATRRGTGSGWSLDNNTVGTGRTFTVTTVNPFANGGIGFYGNGRIVHDSGTGDFVITGISGTGPWSITGDVIEAFAASGAQTAAALVIPGAHRLDYNDEEEAIDIGSNYTQIHVCGLRSLLDCEDAFEEGVITRADIEADIAYEVARPGYSELSRVNYFVGEVAA
jgi:hypothetical protein